MVLQTLQQDIKQGNEKSCLNKFIRLAFPILDALRQGLSWTHYRILSRIEEVNVRNQYVKACAEAGWDTRTLQRNIKTRYLERVLVPQDQHSACQPFKGPVHI